MVGKAEPSRWEKGQMSMGREGNTKHCRQRHFVEIKAPIRLLLEKGAEVNATGGLYGNALQAAASGGYKATVHLLLKKGSDVNGTEGLYGNAMEAAVYGV